MIRRHLDKAFGPALGFILLSSLLLCHPDVAGAATDPGRSTEAPAAAAEPIRIVPTPQPISAARPYQRYEGLLSEMEVGLFDDAVDREWNDHVLIEAALIAGGADGEKQLAESVARFERLVGQAEKSISRDLEPEALARKLFEFMHREVLVGGYELECTNLATTLKTGQFNCVSSTVLFNCLATRFGLAPVGIELPGHAMSRLRQDGENMDVETTCPMWFQLKHDPERRAALIAKTLGVEAHDLAKRPGREVSPIELVAMIYYNRGVDLLTSQQFSQAAAANAKALRLDPASETARGNLLATLNNWAISVGSVQNYEEAIDLLDQGLSLDAKYETFTANYVHLHYQWAGGLCEKHQFEAALEVLRRASDDVLGADRAAQLRLEVYRRWARRLLQQGDSAQAMQVLQSAEDECRPVADLFDQVEAQMLAEGATLLASQNRRQEAVSLLEWGLERQPRSKLLSQRRKALGAVGD